MSVKSLVADPEFQKLSPQEKQAALGAVDPEFKNIGVNEVDRVVQAIGGQSNRKLFGMIPVTQKAYALQDKAEQGLNMLADAVPKPPTPTGNLALDVAKGAPSILAESALRTAAKVAPAFVSPEAIGMEAAGPAIRGALSLARPAAATAANTLEGLSGLENRAPGALMKAANDPTLMFARGRKAAGPLYDAAREKSAGESIFAGMYKPHDIVDTAKAYLAKGGTLEPDEALMARKAVGKLIKKGDVVPDELFKLKEKLDSMAKASSEISAADALHQRGVQAEQLRKLLPQNKYGGTSRLATAGLFFRNAIRHNPLMTAVETAAFSPAAQGALYTAGGLAARSLGLSPGAVAAAFRIQPRKKE